MQSCVSFAESVITRPQVTCLCPRITPVNRLGCKLASPVERLLRRWWRRTSRQSFTSFGCSFCWVRPRESCEGQSDRLNTEVTAWSRWDGQCRFSGNCALYRQRLYTLDHIYGISIMKPSPILYEDYESWPLVMPTPCLQRTFHFHSRTSWGLENENYNHAWVSNSTIFHISGNVLPRFYLLVDRTSAGCCGRSLGTRRGSYCLKE